MSKTEERHATPPPSPRPGPPVYTVATHRSEDNAVASACCAPGGQCLLAR